MHRSRKDRTGTTDARPQQRLGAPEERYARMVVRAEDGCWGWSGPASPAGYGRIGVLYAHRVSYELHHGPIPPGMFVMHACDNPPCTRPDHLSVGTHVDNMADSVSKGRTKDRPNRPSGERNGQSVLTAEQVREIRRLRSEGVPRRVVSARFGVSIQRISAITTGKAWQGVA